MRHTRTLGWVGWALALVGTVACGPEGARAPSAPLAPTSPTVTPTPAPTGPSSRFTVTDGWTNAPVPQARVTIGDRTVTTDAAGRFEAPTSTPCAPATIVATGYLERQVLTLCRFVPDISLWPVTNEAERTALQTFAFRSGQLVRLWQVDASISLDVVNRDAVTTSWRNAGDALAALTDGKAMLRLGNVQGEGAIVAPWSDAADCNHSWFDWRFSTAGFCWGNTAEYFVYMLRVAPSLMASDHVALRALLYDQGLRPHRLPGLLNETQPADTLSEFERRTLRMLTLRDRPWPGGVSWPDTEF